MNLFDSIFGTRYLIDAACFSDKGKVRGINEDNFYFNGKYLPESNNGLKRVLSEETELKDSLFFAVFDGMGGGDYGEIASYTSAAFSDSFLADSDNINRSDITLSLRDMCLQMNEKVFETGEELGAYMFGSTVVSVYFCTDQMWFSNVGDSRAYLYRNHKLEQVSKDHIETNEYAKSHRQKPALLQHLGIDPEEIQLEPTINRFHIERGDVILLCSDGLTDMVDNASIAAELSEKRSPTETVQRLYEKAMHAGGIDNITVIIIAVI